MTITKYNQLKLLAQARNQIRLHSYSSKTEKIYVHAVCIV